MAIYLLVPQVKNIGLTVGSCSFTSKMYLQYKPFSLPTLLPFFSDPLLHICCLNYHNTFLSSFSETLFNLFLVYQIKRQIMPSLYLKIFSNFLFNWVKTNIYQWAKRSHVIYLLLPFLLFTLTSHHGVFRIPRAQQACSCLKAFALNETSTIIPISGCTASHIWRLTLTSSSSWLRCYVLSEANVITPFKIAPLQHSPSLLDYYVTV